MSKSSTSVTAKDASKILGLKNPHFIAAYIHIDILKAEKLGIVTKIDKDELKKFAQEYGLPYNDNDEVDSDQTSEENHG